MITDKQIMLYVAGRMVKAREECGLKQSDVEDLGIAKQYAISRYENVERFIPVPLLFRLARLYGKNITYFFPEEGEYVTVEGRSFES